MHTSIAGGLHLSLRRAHALKCSTLQIFTHNPRAWATAPVSERESRIFRKLRKELDLYPAFAHASYLINIASADEGLQKNSLALLAEEMERASRLGIEYVVLHTGTSYDPDGKLRAAESIRSALKGRRGGAGLLVENTSGKRGDVAPTIEDLALIIERSEGLVSGICLDSCHAFAAGYDIGLPAGVRKLSGEIEKKIGPGMLKLIHLNDSKGAYGSRADRHEHLGKGKIGFEALRRFVNHRLFRGAPVILETPKKNETDDVANLKVAKAMLGLI